MNQRSRRWQHIATTAILSGSLMTLAGCCAFSNSGECSAGDDDASSPGASPTPGQESASIYDLNQSPPADDTVVTVTGIVTALHYSGTSFWIEDPQGGQYSGLYIYDKDQLGATAGIAVGDEVSVTGLFQVYYGVRQIATYASSGGAISVLESGAGLPAPLELSSLLELQTSDVCTTESLTTDLEPYMNVLLKTPEVTIASGVGACDGQPGWGVWSVEDEDGNLLLLDDDVGSDYAPIPGTQVQATGVLYFSFSQVKLEVTDVDELSAPPPPEGTDIYSLNQEPPTNNTVVTTTGIVTNITFGDNFWIEDPAGGLYSGIYVYDPNHKGTTAGIAIGDKVTVTGLFTVYYDLREISIYEEEEQGAVILEEAGAGLPPALELSDLSALQVPDICSTAAQAALDGYVGVLLQLPTTTVSSGDGVCESTYGLWAVEDEAGNTLVVDDDTYEYSPVVGTELEMSGVLTYSYEQYKLEPTMIDDGTVQPPPGTITSIYDLNQTPPSQNSVVDTTGVVIGITNNGNFWIEDPAGGQNSGIYVYDKNNKKGQAAGIEVGDKVEVVGVFQVYSETRQIAIYEEDEKGAVTVLEKNVGTPQPLLLDSFETLSYGCSSEHSAALDAISSILLKFPTTTIVEGIGACSTDEAWGVWAVEDSAQRKLLIDDDTYEYEPVVGTQVELTGIYAFRTDNYELYPTAIDDGDDSTPGPTPEPTPDSTPEPAVKSTIYELNQSPPANDTSVTTSGVVTATTSAGNFWIEDAAGGLYSGIYVYDSAHKKGQAAGIAIGDAVTVVGAFKTYYGLREIQIYEEDALGSVTIDTKGAGTPAPVVLDSLSTLQAESLCSTAADVENEPYVGVLLKLPTTTVSTGKGACDSDTTLGLYTVADVDGNSLIVDDDTYAYSPVVGTELELSGVLTYAYSQYRLEPTSIDDGDTSTPTPTDSEVVSIYDLNQDPPADGTVVTTSGIVTGIAYNNDFWIEAAEGGQYSGIYVYDKKDKGVAAGIQVGDEVRLTAVFTVYYDERQLSIYDESEMGRVEIITIGAGVPEPLALDDLSPLQVEDICTTAVDNDVEPYVGVLLKTPAATVAAIRGACSSDAQYGEWMIEDDSGYQLLVDDTISYSYTPTLDEILQLTGILRYSYEQYRLNPQGDAGIVVQ